jgi:DNA polymerase-3 subunit delta
MPPSKPTDARREATAKPGVLPVYALVGGDQFLQTRKLSAIAAAMGEATQRADFDGESATAADVFDELRSFAMFSAAKLVTVRDADDFVTRAREALEDYVAAPSPGSTLVLRLSSLPKNTRLYKAIAAAGGIEECDPPRPRELPAWIIEHARREHSLTMTSAAAAMLADLIGSDLGRLDQELAKLAIGSAGKKIDAADLAGTIAFAREMEMWNLTDALTAGDKAQALRRWRQLVQSDSSAEFRAVTWLAMWLESLRRAIEMRKRREPDMAIARACRVFDPQLARSFLATAAKFGDDGVDQAVRLLADVDRRSKSGLGDAAQNIERFILTLSF